MFNSTQNVEDDICQLSEAFAEDTRSSTWPPRSYTCSFCRREFRSAQALGGHMNVHRRDRAQLHHRGQAQAQTQTQTPTQTRDHLQSIVFGSSSSADPFLNWANDVGFGVVDREELAFLYQLANNNHEIINSFGVMPSRCVVNDEMQVNGMLRLPEVCSKKNEVEEPIEELDLELRLGHLHTKIR